MKIKNTLFLLLFFFIPNEIKFLANNIYIIKQESPFPIKANFVNDYIIHFKELKNIDNLQRNLDRYIEQHTNNNIQPGASLLGFQGTNPLIVINHNFSATNKIHLASISKSFTALLTLILEEKGYLSLQDPVSKIFPVYKNFEKEFGEILIEDLLTHSSGISYEAKLVNYENLFIPIPSFPKGKFHYSNHNYNLISLILEKVTQNNFNNLMKKYLLEPIKLNYTEVHKYGNGSGGIHSNGYDLILFGQFLLNDFYSRKENSYLYRIIAMAEKKINKKDKWNEVYSYGMYVKFKDGKVFCLHHAGTWNGVSSFVVLFPAYHLVFSFVSNPPSYQVKSVLEFRGTIQQIIENYILSQ